MSISLNSLKNFAIVNGCLFILGYMQYSAMMYYEQKKSMFSPYSDSFVADCLFTTFLFLVRNYALIFFTDYGNRHKPRINKDPAHDPKEHYPGEFHFNVLTTTMLEAITHVILKKTIFLNSLFLIKSPLTLVSIVTSLVTFVPVSFCFEIVLDLFHYLSHRVLHHRWFYKYAHKKHHAFQHPTTIMAFYQDPLDVILTNSIPTYLALYLTSPMISYSQFHWILIYKSVIEVSGHCGKAMYPSTSFPQFELLPKMLSIELSTEDHDLHHSLNHHLHHSGKHHVHPSLDHYNYGKRFSIWDKAFGTYESPFDEKLKKKSHHVKVNAKLS